MTTAEAVVAPLGVTGEQASIPELFEQYEPPVAVVSIDPCLPDWEDEAFGRLIGYNSGTPIYWNDKWYIPVRAEFQHDEHYSVVLWREWPRGATPEPDTRPGREGDYVIKLKVPEREPFDPDGAGSRAPGTNEIWWPGQDPSTWTAALPETEGGEPRELLFTSHTEVAEAWDEVRELLPGTPDALARELQEGERIVVEGDKRYVARLVQYYKYRNVILAGSDLTTMEPVFVSSWGNKNIFGIGKSGPGMILVTRPQQGQLEGSVPQAGPGRLALLEITSMQQLRELDDASLRQAKMVHGFGRGTQEWVGGKQGHIVDGHPELIDIDGAHIAMWTPLPPGLLLHDQLGDRTRQIRIYCAARARINWQTGEVVGQEITAVPWDIRQDAEPKRPELMFVAFGAGVVPKGAEVTLPPGLDDVVGPLRQEVVAYGDGELKLIIRHNRGFDDPTTRDQARQATAEATGAVSLEALMAYHMRQELPRIPDEDDPAALKT